MSGDVPLTVNFSGASSNDPDPGDTIVSYSFDFGDGTPVLTQATATTAHTYQNAGVYPARLSVKDSRGKSSTNQAQVMITATDASPSPTPTPLPCSGTRIEDDDAHISYSNGWHLINNSAASAGHYRLNEGGSSQHNIVMTFDTGASQVRHHQLLLRHESEGWQR